MVPGRISGRSGRFSGGGSGSGCIIGPCSTGGRFRRTRFGVKSRRGPDKNLARATISSRPNQRKAGAERVAAFPSEVVVHAGGEHIRADPRRIRDRRIGKIGRRAAAQIDMKIFDPRAPVARELDLDAAAGCPARAGLAAPVGGRERAGRRGRVGADLSERAPSGGVKEPVPDRIAEPRPQRSEPVKLLLIARRQRPAKRRKARRRARAAQPAPLEAGFEPDDPRTGLPVVASLDAADGARKLRLKGRKPKSRDIEGVAARAEAAPDIEPGVKSGP